MFRTNTDADNSSLASQETETGAQCRPQSSKSASPETSAKTRSSKLASRIVQMKSRASAARWPPPPPLVLLLVGLAAAASSNSLQAPDVQESLGDQLEPNSGECLGPASGERPKPRARRDDVVYDWGRDSAASLRLLRNQANRGRNMSADLAKHKASRFAAGAANSKSKLPAPI